MNATGVVAVARAAGAPADTERARGEPPYLVYYRGSLEAGEIRGLGFEGEVSEPGAWGRPLPGRGPAEEPAVTNVQNPGSGAFEKPR